MRFRQLAYLVLLVAAIVFGGTARADLLTQYAFTGAGPAVNRNATTVAPNVTAGNITDAPLVSGNPAVTLTRGFSQGYASEPFLAAARNVDGPEQVFFTFNVAANAGFQLDLSSLDFNVARGGGSTPRTYDIRTSLGGFATSLTGVVPVLTQRPVQGGSGYTAVSVDLSAAQFQGLTSPLTFQFRFFTPGVGQNIDFDDITLNGTVAATAVPEASTLPVLAMLGGWMVRRRQRKV